MLIATFLQMSQRYVPVTVEWQREGVKKKWNQKGIKCTEKSSASWPPSLIYNQPGGGEKEMIHLHVARGKGGRGALLKVVPTWHRRQPAS